MFRRGSGKTRLLLWKREYKALNLFYSSTAHKIRQNPKEGPKADFINHLPLIINPILGSSEILRTRG